ncbi:hypothetical protein BIW11_02798 [Tropilaelaps mercedesae]|uniref:Uncharacterized protein n=1 Tax=Tropilaelaps mercedesae TaxID=418985 RepID=A0A1V9XX86_9ACAR|nr:hypothetical protein BIW11_02798 [Tropilaelaps mercedesae]
MENDRLAIIDLER